VEELVTATGVVTGSLTFLTTALFAFGFLDFSCSIFNFRLHGTLEFFFFLASWIA